MFTAGRRLFIAAVENVAELDLFFGAAGIVWSACLLASILQSEWPLRAAARAARILRDSVSEKDGALVWASGADAVADGAVKHVHLGAAHGAAGIAMALAAWGRDTGCAGSLELARETFVRLFENGRTSDGRALRHRLGLDGSTSAGT